VVDGGKNTRLEKQLCIMRVGEREKYRNGERDRQIEESIERRIL